MLWFEITCKIPNETEIVNPSIVDVWLNGWPRVIDLSTWTKPW
jgi:hypothetical protein